MSDKRDVVIKQLNKLLGSRFTPNMIQNMEKSVYNNSIQLAKKTGIPLNWESKEFKEIYIKKGRSLIMILKTNPENLIQRIEEGQIKSKDVSFLSSRELRPLETEQKRQKQIPKPINEDLLPEGLYQCDYCKKYKTRLEQIQIKDTSESMTTFVSCQLCGRRWRE